MTQPRYSICITELATEMPRCFSISIQSLVAWRDALRAFTEPAIWIAPENNSSFSVSVVLPASGCEMMAKVRRRRTSVAMSDMGVRAVPRSVTNAMRRRPHEPAPSRQGAIILGRPVQPWSHAVYMPAHFEEPRVDVLHALVRDHPLATWVVQGTDGLSINHVPFLLDATRGAHGTLIGHVARANPVWQRLGASIAVFQGPQAYVSPNFYPSKRAHGKVVPTWNYAVVHAHGTPRSIDSRDELLAIVTRLTQTHEADSAVPWHVSDAPADYLEQMLKMIVGIEIPIERLEGKWKVSQNRGLPDRLGTVAGLRQRGDAHSSAMAELVAERTDGR